MTALRSPSLPLDRSFFPQEPVIWGSFPIPNTQTPNGKICTKHPDSGPNSCTKHPDTHVVKEHVVKEQVVGTDSLLKNGTATKQPKKKKGPL